MMRHPAKHRPKQVRRLVERLGAAGYAASVAIGRRGYMVSWQASGAWMRIGVGLSATGDSIDRIWAAVRALSRARGLMVPA